MFTAVALAMLVAADTASGAFHHRGKETSLISIPPRSGDLSTLIVVFPGYLMPAAELGRAFASHLDATTGLLLVQYAERGVDPTAIRASLALRLRNLRPERIVFYGASMGGMCAHDVLRGMDGLTTPVDLVLDTAPASSQDVRRPGWFFTLASSYRGGYLASGVWRLLANLPAARPTPELDADRDIINSARHHYATAGMPAVTSEADYIGAFRLRAPSRHPDRVVYLHAHEPVHDPLIKVDQAIARWRTVYPALITEEIKGRQGGWHIPLVERPKETLKAITGI
ncbi:hypothetical protein [Actinomadura hibisca]|uniref:hypothetical protein n=1 Tax=Actinomadura hibisca TaxID=68565 RepID=UPI00082C21D6|nr:hypothetical protein [Actinomadura hibisca]